MNRPTATLFEVRLRALAVALVLGAASVVRAGPLEDFFIAVRNDNVGAVVKALGQGIDPNSRDPKGQPALNVALQERSGKVARTLIERPAIDLDALNPAGESALMMAAIKGDLADVLLLLERGARVNQPGWSALHYAASGPEPKVVALLLDRGADIDAASPNATTPLMMAAQYGSEASVRLLVARGADVSRRNQRDLNAAAFARLAARESLAKLLDQAAATR